MNGDCLTYDAYASNAALTKYPVNTTNIGGFAANALIINADITPSNVPVNSIQNSVRLSFHVVAHDFIASRKRFIWCHDQRPEVDLRFHPI